MSSARGFLGLALVMALAGCPEALRVEGTEPGDCTDGADNDADGLFDCDDATCSGSPDCRGSGDGGSGDGGSSDGGLSDGDQATDAFVATDAALVPEDAGSDDAFLMDAPSVDAFSVDAFSVDAFSVDAFSVDAFSLDAFSADAFSADAFSLDAFSADAFSPDAFSPDAARSPNGASCMTSSTCASGFRVDSVCCNTAFPGTFPAVQAGRPHDLVHQEGGPGHVAGVLQHDDEEEQDQDLGQEDQHAADPGDDAVHHQAA